MDAMRRPRDRSRVERARPERYVADEQISAGYMHSGYPIMTHLDAAPRFVDLARLATEGDWGMFHEMGHNHQHPDWTFDGTVEVTCNLFSLYLMETVCAKGVGHPAMAPESIATNRRRYVLEGASFDTWKSKPFTALIMYYELKQRLRVGGLPQGLRRLPRPGRRRASANRRGASATSGSCACPERLVETWAHSSRSGVSRLRRRRGRPCRGYRLGRPRSPHHRVAGRS